MTSIVVVINTSIMKLTYNFFSTREHLYQESSHTVAKVLVLFSLQQTSKPVDLTKGLSIPRESDSDGKQNLITELLQDWETDS